jgi:hypothetical protein
MMDRGVFEEQSREGQNRKILCGRIKEMREMDDNGVIGIVFLIGVIVGFVLSAFLENMEFEDYCKKIGAQYYEGECVKIEKMTPTNLKQ